MEPALSVVVTLVVTTASEAVRAGEREREAVSGMKISVMREVLVLEEGVVSRSSRLSSCCLSRKRPLSEVFRLPT